MKVNKKKYVKIAVMEKVLNFEINQVYNAVSDFANYHWRSDLKNVKKIDELHFVEISKNGFETTFVITKKIKNEILEFEFFNKNMKGHWVGKFEKINNTTKVVFTEQVEVSHFLLNLFALKYLKKQQKLFMKDLEMELQKQL